MFSLIKDLGLRLAMKQEAVPFLIAFAIAEFFFKFKSFALECIAFLAVWFVLSFIQSLFVAHDGARNLRPERKLIDFATERVSRGFSRLCGGAAGE
jgi:hypothetical protein